jgi:mannose-6-phosphate isomerase
MVALTDFWLLHGFRSEAEIAVVLESEPAFLPLQPILKESGIYGLYKTIMEWSQDQVAEVLQPLQSRLSQAHLTDKAHPDFWAKQAFEQYGGEDGDYDRGIFSIYLFNLVHIPPGKGIFQGAGIPHAYLEGVNVELMSNSDNVFRGGLTVKHVDVPMLLSHLKFDAVTPEVLEGEALDGFEVAYKTPAADFQLNRVYFPESGKYKPEPPKTAEIVLITEGTVVSGNDGQVFSQGEAFFVPAGTSYELDVEEYTTLFKALVPVSS